MSVTCRNLLACTAAAVAEPVPAIAATSTENGQRASSPGSCRANSGAQPTLARDRATAAGITINGLAILNEELFVDHYYRDSVIGGPQAFVIPARDYDAFAGAMVEKLIREIGLPLT